MKRTMTLGVDKHGQVYGIAVDENGEFVPNSLGYSTSCYVIRPVSQDTLDYLRNDEESVLEIWQMAVGDDTTRLGLKDFFEELNNAECENSCFDPGEWWLMKDESWCLQILLDTDNPTVDAFIERRDKAIGLHDDLDLDDAEVWYLDSGGEPVSFRGYVENLIYENLDIPENQKGGIATWESSGWFSPKEPFAIELAPKEFLEKYYRHLAEKDNEFKMTGEGE